MPPGKSVTYRGVLGSLGSPYVGISSVSVPTGGVVAAIREFENDTRFTELGGPAERRVA